jgi:hypothetical protein
MTEKVDDVLDGYEWDDGPICSILSKSPCRAGEPFAVVGFHWLVEFAGNLGLIANGPETGPEGRRLAEAALRAYLERRQKSRQRR